MSGWTIGAGALGLPALALAGVWLWGRARPASHVATVSRTVAAPPERVWEVVVDYGRHAEWRSGLKAARRVGDRVEETDRRGDVLAYVVEEERAPGRMSSRRRRRCARSGRRKPVQSDVGAKRQLVTGPDRRALAFSTVSTSSHRPPSALGELGSRTGSGSRAGAAAR